MRFTQIFYLLLTALFLSQCAKDSDTFTPLPPVFISKVELGQMTTLDVYGQIFDEEGRPLSGAKVSIWDQSYFTDDEGFFFAKNARLRDKLGRVLIEKEGYFTLPKTLQVGDSKQFVMQAQLLRKTPAGTFESAQGGALSHEEVSLSFVANSIVNNSGEIYRGPVVTYIRRIDPDQPNFEGIMPATLVGARTNGDEAIMATYGMIAVELESPSGDKLQVAPGATVTTRFPIPESLLDIAPNSIPLWSLDKAGTFWIEEGTALREGGYYVGKLPHFSFWNCDVPYPLAEVKFRLVDESGQPIPFTSVKIEVQGSGISGFSMTNEEGIAIGKVPAGEDLKLYISSAFTCSQYFFLTDLGPFAQGSFTDLGNLLFTGTSLTLANYSGTLYNCEGNLSSNGYIRASLGNTFQIFPVDPADGSFSFSLIFCPNLQEATLYGVDQEELSISEGLVVSDNPNTQDLGALYTCEQLDQFLRIVLGSEEYLLVENIFLSYLDGCQLNLGSESSASFFEYFIYCDPGTLSALSDLPVNVPIESGILHGLNYNLGQNFYTQISQGNESLTLTLSTSLLPSNPYLSGLVEGMVSVVDSTQGVSTLPFLLEFKVKND
jgi:hypothetical protein